MCSIGEFHTITLSDGGVVHSFGSNYSGQLGLNLEYTNNYVFIPTPIPSLPKIKQIACGWSFTACVDEDGFLWVFGRNKDERYGKFGTGNKTEFNVPQQIQNIPPVQSVACGASHALIITNDSNLWSCGDNYYGQLCLGNQERQLTFKQTSFSNISKISVGGFHSLFQDIKGDICGCGYNDSGELGLGHFDNPQIAPILISNLPSNIIQFVCGFFHNLFLD